MTDSSFFTSWSGGKDSSLALYRALEQGAKPSALLTMMLEDGQRSRSHGLARAVLEEQAKCLDIPIRFCSTSWTSYTPNFKKELTTLKESGIECGVFGDIDLEEHRLWVERVCGEAGVKPWLPLWNEPREILLNELLSAGFRAVIIALKDGVLSPDLLGRILDEQLIDEFQSLGIDLCGEAGEYHTLVTNGPFFNYPLDIEYGRTVLKDGYWFLDVSVLYCGAMNFFEILSSEAKPDRSKAVRMRSPMAIAMGDEEDRSGEAAAEKIRKNSSPRSITSIGMK